jgi:hypothetical protein
MRLEEVNPGRRVDKEGSEKLKTYERRERRGPAVENYVIEMAAEINTEGSEVWV